MTAAVRASDSDALAAKSLANDPKVSAECILTLYKQVPNSFAAAIVVTVFMVFTAWPYTRPAVVFTWLGIQTLSQVGRFALLLLYRRARPQGEALKAWAGYYTLYMLAAGAIWAGTLFAFVVPSQPLTIALTLCGLYGISAGSVPGNAYNLPGCYAFIGVIFAAVLVRTVMIGDFGHIVLGLASALFAVIMLMFARVQNGVLREGFAIRFENVKILAEMKEARERAEQARRQAETANLAKSQFLAAASHDLRQPLYALSLFSGSLKALALTDEAAHVVRHIQDNIAAMETLFNGLLDLSRLEAGAVKAEISPFALQPVFDRLQHYFAPTARDKGLDLRLRSSSAWVRGDEVLVEQILMNLIANALRYTSSGTVLIAARRRGLSIRIEVRDSGEGIAAPDRQRIFDEFVQIGNAERDRRKGLGLGLAICARTAALLGTRIELSSTPGKGSIFAFELQAEVPDITAKPDLPSLPEHTSGAARPHLLIIDDDAAVREALGLLLAGWNVDLTLCDTLDAARQALDTQPPYHLILSDYRLREGHAGLDFLIELKSRPDCPSLALITGDVDPALMRRASEADIFLIHKPVDPARLRALVNHLTRSI